MSRRPADNLVATTRSELPDTSPYRAVRERVVGALRSDWRSGHAPL